MWNKNSKFQYTVYWVLIQICKLSIAAAFGINVHRICFCNLPAIERAGTGWRENCARQLLSFMHRARSLDQQQRKRTSSGPLQHIEQRKCVKLTIAYWHQYTVNVVQSFTFLRSTIENCKNIFNQCYYNVTFVLFNGWNVTKTCFYHAWAGMEGSCLRAQG